MVATGLSWKYIPVYQHNSLTGPEIISYRNSRLELRWHSASSMVLGRVGIQFQLIE